MTDCRICLKKNNKTSIKVCKCDLIHKECLKKWIEIKVNPEYCEICLSKYNVNFTIIPIHKNAIIIDNNNMNNISFKCTLLFSIIILVILIYIIYLNSLK